MVPSLQGSMLAVILGCPSGCCLVESELQLGSMVSEFFWRNGVISPGDTFFCMLLYIYIYIVSIYSCIHYVMSRYICIYICLHTIIIKRWLDLAYCNNVYRISYEGVPSMPGEGRTQSHKSHSRSQTQSCRGGQKIRHRGSHPTSWSKGEGSETSHKPFKRNGGRNMFFQK